MKVDCLMSVFTQPYGKNEERWLREAIDSVLKQTFRDFTFICVDDGSTRKSIQILEEYRKQDPRIKVYHKKNTGLTDSLNFGLKFCKGDYIVRQDVDDVSAPTRFEKELEILEKYPKCGASGCWYHYINENGLAYHTVKADPMVLETPRVAGSLAGGGCALRKSALLQVGGWKQRFAQDAYCWLMMRSLGWELRNVPEVLFSYRVHKGQISQRFRGEQRAIAHSMAVIAMEEIYAK